jgi:hypothetical protein
MRTKDLGTLDRYEASCGNLVPVAQEPHSGPRRAKRAKEILANQPRALPGYQGQSPWLVHGQVQGFDSHADL